MGWIPKAAGQVGTAQEGCWEHPWQCKVSSVLRQSKSNTVPQPSSSSTLQLGQKAFPLSSGLKAGTGHWLALQPACLHLSLGGRAESFMKHPYAWPKAQRLISLRFFPNSHLGFLR